MDELNEQRSRGKTWAKDCVIANEHDTHKQRPQSIQRLICSSGEGLLFV